MDYEKKYKDALSWIRGVYPTFEGAVREDAEHYFPELIESDERIRKYLLRLADRCPEDSIDFMGEVKKEDVVAWLEKQGGQKHTWSKEDEEELDNIIDFLNSPSTAELCPTLRSNTIDWVNSLKGRLQPQWKPSEEQIAALRRLANSGKSDLYDYRHLKRLLEQLEKL